MMRSVGLMNPELGDFSWIHVQNICNPQKLPNPTQILHNFFAFTRQAKAEGNFSDMKIQVLTQFYSSR